ncbi:hypothetical protein QN277_025059 [Acacia crassicarpa]|uniref:WRKY domain-containing protein n=1 Tax=Acacia crassicarpa TaxID=499986 RepID=A0AAE1JI34_9FABA|nr:hypothetical protein QN277_025059 [Acacia crassicarpa]
MENLMAVKELERGREFANQLRRLISRGVDHEDDKVKGLTTSSAEDLAAKVLDSFTNALSLFNHHSADSSISTSSFSHMPARSDEFHEDRKTKSPATVKDRTRSSPKKRKSAQIQTWVEDSKMSPKEDGHAWRKYGEKIILNAKHPRNYYRCTHKYDQGCEAIKHVQKIQDDPPIFRTTYFGHHTCTNPHIFLDSHNVINSTSAFILSFENNNHNNNNNNNLITTVDPENKNNNASSFFASSGSLFPSSSSVKKEDHSDDNIKQEKNNNYNNDVIINVVASCSSNNDFFVSHRHEEEAVLPALGSGDYDQVDVFNSAAFYDPLGEFEDLLFEII